MARKPGAEKCLRLLKADTNFLKKYGITNASRFGPDGKLHPTGLYVEVKSRLTESLPREYPIGNGRALIAVANLASNTQVATGSSHVPKPITSGGGQRRGVGSALSNATSNLSAAAAPEQVRIIAGTRRKDGTVRKDVQVRAGFKSEELDINTYKSSKAIAYQKRRVELKTYIPGAPDLTRALREKQQTAGQKRAEKRRAARERKRQAKAATEKGDTQPQSSKSNKDAQPATVSANITASNDNTGIQKRIRAVAKKLRQISQLKAKAKAGEALEESQKAKISTEASLADELTKLQLQVGN